MAPKKYLMAGDVVPKLIKEVEKRECIWHPEDLNYADRYTVLAAWKDISEALGLPDHILRAKWKGLRDLFRRQIRTSYDSNLDHYKGRWRFFRKMMFLLKTGYFPASNEEFIETIDEVDEADEEANPLALESKFEPDYVDDRDLLDEGVPEKRRKYTEDDYDMMYLKSLTPYFSQLEPLRKLVVRSKIQDMLMNEIAAQASASKISNGKKT